ncbi:MAG: hypothetical protein DPW22_09395 [Alphaproteobacteria bacterium]|nr:hypothetical protein [Alphaproteobacteria bacterium]
MSGRSVYVVMLLAVNFHYIRPSFDAPYPAIFGETPAQFLSQITRLARHVEFVSPYRVAQAVAGESDLPERACLITFDDGLAEQFEIAYPLLQRVGIPAAFYVNTSAIADHCVMTVHKAHYVRAQTEPRVLEQALLAFAQEHGVDVEIADDADRRQYRYDDPAVARFKFVFNFRLNSNLQSEFIDRRFRAFCDDEAAFARQLYMSKEMVRALGAGQMVGTHTHAHRSLGEMNDSDIGDDIRMSLDLLSEWGVGPVRSISYPFGGPQACPLSVAGIAAAQGLRFGLTMERAANFYFREPMFLARFACNDVPGGRAFKGDEEAFFATLPEAQFARVDMIGS